MTAQEFRRIALRLPDAVESAHMSHPDFRVHGKVFATLGYPDRAMGHGQAPPGSASGLCRCSARHVRASQRRLGQGRRHDRPAGFCVAQARPPRAPHCVGKHGTEEAGQAPGRPAAERQGQLASSLTVHQKNNSGAVHQRSGCKGRVPELHSRHASCESVRPSPRPFSYLGAVGRQVPKSRMLYLRMLYLFEYDRPRVTSYRSLEVGTVELAARRAAAGSGQGC